MSGMKENKMSEKGLDNTKGSRGSETVHSIEHVGSTGSGIRFKMPTDVVDHSCVKRDLKE